jgi:UDP-glucose:(heptosyl)LPS alpha-1,3-glucosyltransferase
MIQIAQACRARGHQVTVLTRSWEGAQPAGMEVDCIPTSAYTNHGRAFQFAQRVQEHLQQHRPDGVVGFNKMPGLDVHYAADGCFAARSDPGALARWLPRYRLYRRLEAAVFSPETSTLILALTPGQQRDYQSCYRTPAERFVQLPPNLSPERRRPAQAATLRTEIRHTLGMGPRQQMLLQVGSSFHTKGLDRSLRALAALPADRRQQTRLVIAGSGKTRPWERMARKLGVRSAVQFLGPREDVMQLMLGADLLLHPSRRESAGIVLLEALVAGLPTIVSAACGYSFHVERAGSGWVLPAPFSQTDLDRCLQTALEDGNLPLRQQQALDYSAKTPLHGMVDTAVAAIERTVLSGPPESD